MTVNFQIILNMYLTLSSALDPSTDHHPRCKVSPDASKDSLVDDSSRPVLSDVFEKSTILFKKHKIFENKILLKFY